MKAYLYILHWQLQEKYIQPPLIWVDYEVEGRISKNSVNKCQDDLSADPSPPP